MRINLKASDKPSEHQTRRLLQTSRSNQGSHFCLDYYVRFHHPRLLFLPDPAARDSTTSNASSSSLSDKRSMTGSVTILWVGTVVSSSCSRRRCCGGRGATSFRHTSSRRRRRHCSCHVHVQHIIVVTTYSEYG
jgi:hypothetical protein